MRFGEKGIRDQFELLQGKVASRGTIVLSEVRHFDERQRQMIGKVRRRVPRLALRATEDRIDARHPRKAKTRLHARVPQLRQRPFRYRYVRRYLHVWVTDKVESASHERGVL